MNVISRNAATIRSAGVDGLLACALLLLTQPWALAEATAPLADAVERKDRERALALDLERATTGTLPMVVDPSRGPVLGLLVQVPGCSVKWIASNFEFSRIAAMKHLTVLEEAGLGFAAVDHVAFYDKPFLKFERILETYLAFAPSGFRSFLKAMPLWMRQKLHLPREIRRELEGEYRRRIVFTEHHESHAASAFFPSPFEEAAILTLDGVVGTTGKVAGETVEVNLVVDAGAGVERRQVGADRLEAGDGRFGGGVGHVGRSDSRRSLQR